VIEGVKVAAFTRLRGPHSRQPPIL